MKRGRFLVNIVNEKYKENLLSSNNKDSKTNLDTEPQINKENIPLNTIMTYQGHSRQILNDLILSSSEESFIENSDSDPTYIHKKKKHLPRKIIPSYSSSSSVTSSSNCSNSSDRSSSSSDSETETTDTLAQCRSQNVVPIESMAVYNTVGQLQTRNNVDTELRAVNNLTVQPQCHVVNELSNEQPNEEVKRGKKKLRRESTWKANISKVLRNSGKSYQSLSKSKKVFNDRKVRPACGESCRQRCSFKINEETRQNIFDGYWGLADLQRQREYIIRHTQEIKPKYRYSCTHEFRNLNRAFYFEVAGNKVRVCKSFFKATLDVSNTSITTALAKKHENGIVATDLRGKHGNQMKIDQGIKDSITEFINSIPRIESHYLRAQTSREFIGSDKSLADLYRDYKEARELKQLSFATKSTFNRIFNTEFNLGFYIPKKDLCDLCEGFKNANEEEKNKLRENYEQHLLEKNLARDHKEKDKNRNDGVIVAVYDLQAVMQVPKGQVSLFFYKSRINCFNFTISDLRAQDVICFFWDEIVGKRGAVEIGSCVLRYIDTLLQKHPDKDIAIIFYSDNCGGQQKNKYLLTAYAYAVVTKRVKSITHKFLIRGHSQNEGDNVHSVIEKQIKRHIKSGPIYTPQQYCTLIRTAKKTGRPYQVEEMTQEQFYDTKMLQEEWGTNFNLDEDRNQVKWHDIKILRVEKENPGAFFYKSSFSDENFKKVSVRKRRTKDDQIVFTGLKQAYSQKIPFSEAKVNDIKELITKNAIPQQYVDSYF